MRSETLQPRPIEVAELEWRDGSLFSSKFGDRYFSSSGAVEEGKWVYLKGNDLPNKFCCAKKFTIGELGFGTGLNFLLTLRLWIQLSPKDSQLFYIAYEKHPLKKSDIKSILESLIGPDQCVDAFLELYPAPMEGLHIMDFPEQRCRLLLFLGEIAEKLKETTASINAWYLDGFSPEKNSAMWSEEVINLISDLSESCATLTSYSVASIIRDRLCNCGWQVERIPGFGKKRHMLSCRYQRVTRVTEPVSAGPPKKVIVVGAGIAGCSLVETFHRRGSEVVVVDPSGAIATGASATEFAVVFPYPSTQREPRQRFYQAAFEYLISLLRRQNVAWNQTGIMFYPFRDRQQGIFEKITQFGLPQQFVQPLNSEHASEVAGIKLTDRQLYFSSSGYLSLPLFCRDLLKGRSELISTQTLPNSCDALILATGYNLEFIPSSIAAKLTPVRGETAYFASTPESHSLRLPLCAEGYIIPQHGNRHLVGATFQRWQTDRVLTAEGREILAKKFKNFFPLSTPLISDQWVGIRCATHDRLPIVGKIHPEDNLANFAQTANFAISVGHGSRAALSAPLSAELLAASMFNEPLPIEKTIIDAISTHRCHSQRERSALA